MISGIGGVGGNSPLYGSNSGPSIDQQNLFNMAQNLHEISSETPPNLEGVANQIQYIQGFLSSHSKSFSEAEQDICQKFCGASFEYCVNPCDETNKIRNKDFKDLKSALNC
jgi:hypothetical protein